MDAGAKKSALGDQDLTQIMADIHFSEENKICGKPDWYGILHMNPLDDDEMVKKQFKKLALLFHPDKNKSAEADGTFKLISQAYSSLSDKTKRTAYDSLRISRPSQMKVSSTRGRLASPSGANHRNTTSRKVGGKKSFTRKPPPTAPGSESASDLGTFWTTCHNCMMQYKYDRVYFNLTLRCINCHEGFLATEALAPTSHITLIPQ